jgi:hypothetical protein
LHKQGGVIHLHAIIWPTAQPAQFTTPGFVFISDSSLPLAANRFSSFPAQLNPKETIMQIARAALVSALAATLLTGCGNNSAPTQTAGSPTVVPILAAAETNSFAQVTSHLDAGGNLYLYLGTAQWLDGLSQKVGAWRDTIQSLPNVQPDQRDKLVGLFDLATNLIQDSGIEDVSGFGMSSIAVEKGFYRTKMVLHHYPGRGNGFLWTAFGAQPHPLDGLDLLPTTTAFAGFGDLDLAQLWSAVEKDLTQSGIPEINQGLTNARAGFKQATGLDFDDTLASLGGEYGIIITLDATKTVSIPTGPTPPLQFPEPGILVVTKVKDDLIFNRVKEVLQQGKLPLMQTDTNGLRMLSVTVPFPLPITLKPSIARSGDYLFIATSDTLIEQVLAVQAGKQPGLKSTDEFKKLAEGLPTQGNRFAYVSKRFGETWIGIQQQIADRAALDNAGQGQLIRKFATLNPPAFAFSVAANTPEGWMMTDNGSQDGAKLVLLPMVAMPAAAAGMVLPALANAKAKAQKVACANNLRLIQAAKKRWALQNSKSPTDTPTWEDLRPYLGGKILSCPGGGDYSINSVGEQPTCSVHSHTD